MADVLTGPQAGSGTAPGAATDATARALWAELGAAGRIRNAYRDGRPERGVDPAGLRALLGELDASHGAGLVLSVCVQLASALPLLAETAPDSAAAEEAFAGRAMVALAATDTGPGSDLTGLHTAIREETEGFAVTGTKRWITNAVHADHLLVLARRRPGPHFTNFTWLLVRAIAPGVRVEPADTELFAGAGIGHVHLDGVSVPATAVLGGAGRGLPLFARHIAVERLAGGLWAAAMCHRVLAATKAWLVERGLWDHDGVRHRFAAALVSARQLDALVASAGPPIAERHDHAAAALVKAAAGTATEEVLTACAHLRGAEGFTTGGLQQQRAEAALFGIAGGSTEVVLSGVADQADRLLGAFDPTRPS